MSNKLPMKPKAASSASASEAPRSTLELPASYAGADGLPAVDSRAGLDAQDMEEVRLAGTYVEFDARNKQQAPAQFRGHAAIRLGDGTVVTLFPTWHRDALRPQAEIDAHKDKAVVVVGMVFAEGPASPKGGASLKTPCIMDVKGLWPT